MVFFWRGLFGLGFVGNGNVARGVDSKRRRGEGPCTLEGVHVLCHRSYMSSMSSFTRQWSLLCCLVSSEGVCSSEICPVRFLRSLSLFLSVSYFVSMSRKAVLLMEKQLVGS